MVSWLRKIRLGFKELKILSFCTAVTATPPRSAGCRSLVKFIGGGLLLPPQRGKAKKAIIGHCKFPLDIKRAPATPADRLHTRCMQPAWGPMLRAKNEAC